MVDKQEVFVKFDKSKTMCEICDEVEVFEVVRMDAGERWIVCEDCGERLRESGK